MNEEQIKEKYAGTINSLMNYMHIGIISRTFMMQNHCENLADIIKKNNTNEKSKSEEISELLTYKELFERLCLVIEDFSIIFNALSLELSDFHKNILHQPNVEKILQKIDKASIYKVLKYDDISYMANEDKEVIECYRNKNIKMILEINNYMQEFIKYNWLIYTKLKHGNTVIYNYEKINLDNIPTYVLPVMYNTKKPQEVRALVLNYPIYKKMLMLFNSILILTESFCETNYEYICNCELENILGSVYVDSFSKNEYLKVKEILKKYPKKSNHYDINLCLKWDADINKIKDIINMYKKIKVVIDLNREF